MKNSTILVILAAFAVVSCSTFGSSSSSQKEAELLENGYIALSAGDYNTAEHLLNQALYINDENPYTLLNLGVVYQDTQRYKQARDAYQAVIDMNPSDTAASANVKGYSGRNLVEIAKVNLANLPPFKLDTPPDADGDGVPDDSDWCMNTPPRAAVDANGCWNLTDIFIVSGVELKPGTVTQLDDAVLVLMANPSLRIEIQGHTDNSGSDELNQRLSEKRSKAIYDYLVRKGVPADRLTYKGYGESRPIASNLKPEGREQNRRIELVPLP